jgi:hypothetical protein
MVKARRIALLGALLMLGALAQAQDAGSTNDTLPTLVSNLYPGGNCPTTIQAIRYQYVVPVAAGPVGASACERSAIDFITGTSREGRFLF